jgi:hypothetical protein
MDSDAAMYGSRVRTKLHRIFFSQKNIDLIQKMIIHSVYDQTFGSSVISNQSEEEIRVIMRAIYLQFAKECPKNQEREIRKLNVKVLESSVPIILDNIQMHKRHVENFDSVPRPMARPKNLSSKGSKTNIGSAVLLL